MQKAVFAITIPHFISHPYLRLMQKANHESSIQSITSRFNLHGNVSNKSIEFIEFLYYLLFERDNSL